MKDQRLQPGQSVKFRLGDIHLPDAAEVLSRMNDDVELQGAVTLLSDHGEHRSAFAVVEVKGILMPLIVPASCIHVVPETPEAPAAADQKDDAASRITTRPLPQETQVR